MDMNDPRNYPPPVATMTLDGVLKKFPLKILPFKYDGFGTMLQGKEPVASGRFIEKTDDPGIVKIELHTGEVLLVPTCAIQGELPELKWDNCFDKDSKSILFGFPSELKG